MTANLKVVDDKAPEITFDQFWAAYPRRQAKKDALKAWLTIDPVEYPKILRGIEAAKRSEQWNRDGGQYIPMPATFLRGERWTDEWEVKTEPVAPAGQIKDPRCQQFVNGERCPNGVAFWNMAGTKGNCSKHGPY